SCPHLTQGMPAPSAPSLLRAASSGGRVWPLPLDVAVQANHTHLSQDCSVQSPLLRRGQFPRHESCPMFMDVRQTPGVETLHQIAPWMIAANTLLALSSADLARLLAQEVAQNPALEPPLSTRGTATVRRLLPGLRQAFPRCFSVRDRGQAGRRLLADHRLRRGCV